MSQNFIQAMHMKKGGLHASLGVKQGAKIPVAMVSAAAKKKGKVGKQARLAETLETIASKKNS
jgi:hypothetical protein